MRIPYLIGLSLLSAGSSWAQSSDAPPVTSLSTIEVKASKYIDLPPAYEGNHVATGGNLGLLGNRDVMNTPFSTINYTSDYIEDLQGQELRILISKNDPSVQTPGAGGTGGKDTMYIRGFRAGDVSLNGLQGLTSGRRVMAIAERLEILKGPSAVLNGMNASNDVGGSINLVSKRATDDPITNVTLSYIQPSQFGTHLDLGRRFGESNELGLRLNGVFKDGEGVVDHRTNRDKLISLGADYRLGSVKLSADLYHLEEYISGLNRGVRLAKGLDKNPLPTPPKGNVLLGVPWAAGLTRETTALVRADWAASDKLAVYGSAGYSKSEMSNYNTKGSTLLNEQGDLKLAATRRNNTGYNLAANSGLFYSFDTGSVHHTISAGVDWNRKSSRIDNTSIKGWSETINIYDPDYPARPYVPMNGLRAPNVSYLYSAALADTLSFADGKYQLTLGLRQQWVSTKDKSGKSDNYSKNALTPTIAGVWQLRDDWMLYANYAEGLTRGMIVGDDYANEGQVFAPQKTRQYEIGMKYDSGDYALTAALFDITQPNSYESNERINGKPNLSYDGRQRNRGVEVQVFGQIAENWRLTGGIAYLDPKIRKASNPDTEGRSAVGLSRWVAKAGIEWDTPFVQGLTVNANLHSQSKQYANASNSYYMPGVTTYDLGMRYKTRFAGKELTLRASLENVGNKAYWVVPLSNGQGSPRTFLASATLKF